MKISETQKIGFKHVRKLSELLDFRFNGQISTFRVHNNQGVQVLGATIAFLVEDGKISRFAVAVCSGVEKRFDKYRGKKEALVKLLQYPPFGGREGKEQKVQIWDKFFEEFGYPYMTGILQQKGK